jgi:Fe-S-cluster containining protein
MAELTTAELTLFSLFYGNTELIDDDAFWIMATNLLTKEDGSMVLPLHYNPLTVRRVHSMLKCNAGECGKCCSHYHTVKLNDYDIQRIQENTEHKDISKYIIEDNQNGKHLKGNPCPFLVDNACSIYEYRPDTCYLYPVIGSKVSTDTGTGKEFNALVIRKSCAPSMQVIRSILKQCMKDSKVEMMMLPDLSLTVKTETTNG